MLNWKRKNDEEVRAEYMVNGTLFVFGVIGPELERYNKGEYYLHIRDDKSYIFRVGMGMNENRAKHGAENYLKLVLAGRNPRDIHMWELAVGWESYKKLSSPDFVPTVVDGRLFRKSFTDNLEKIETSTCCN